MRLNGKRVDLPQLQSELLTAGVSVRGLGTQGDDLHTYNGGGTIVDVPASAQAVVDAHIPPPIPPPADYGTDLTPRAQIADAITQLRTYLGVAAPTAAQSATALKLLIRVVLFMLRTMGV